MKPPRSCSAPRSTRALAFIYVAGALMVPIGRPPACEPAAPARGLQIFAVMEQPAERDTTALATVCLVSPAGTPTPVGGYYGEVTFPASLRVVRIDRPANGIRVENAARAGRISFAGASNDGFGTGPIMTAVFALPRSGVAPRVALRIIDINDVAGRSIAGSVHVDTLLQVRPVAR